VRVRAVPPRSISKYRRAGEPEAAPSRADEVRLRALRTWGRSRLVPSPPVGGRWCDHSRHRAGSRRRGGDGVSALFLVV
ncbi:MAG: hypothetical protein AVDCRST_MAG59-5028, partial [uncultured Thermomicrobiales bacterium]